MLGAAYRDLRSRGREQGASTLTMQLSRNLFLSPERSFGRKMQEIFLTIQIERRFTKPQIFTLYANQIYLGHGVFGFEAGSEFYFSKHVKDLTLPEAALLAALRALKRRNLVISEMLQDGKISETEANAAKATPLGLHLAPPPNSVAPCLWRRCASNWSRSSARMRCMRPVCACIRRSTSIYRRRRTRLCRRLGGL